MRPCKGHTLLACSMVCNRSWHLQGNPKLVWHSARLTKEGGCVDLSMDTVHLDDPLILFRFEGSALSLPLLSYRIDMLYHFSSTFTKDHFWGKTLWHWMAMCADVSLSPYSFIYCHIWVCLEAVRQQKLLYQLNKFLKRMGTPQSWLDFSYF